MVPMPFGVASVSPQTTLTLDGSVPTRSATSCANAVSWPWPAGHAPVCRVTAPSVPTRTTADSQNESSTPLLRGPASFDGARPHASI